MPELSSLEITSARSLKTFDPTLSNAEFPLHKMFFPMGYPLEVQTNSSEVLKAAEESWGLYTSRNQKLPLTLRIGVTGDTVGGVPAGVAPIHRLQRNLLSTIVDGHNFLTSDLSAGFSFGWITKETAKSRSYLRYNLLEAAALCMISALHATALHAACVAPMGHGMLLCGDSGVGKSSLAFAGARAGWTFVSDDASYLPFDRDDRTVVGNCYQFRLRDTSVQLFPEVIGRAITSRLSGKPSIEVPAEELPSIQLAESAIVRSIVFLNRRHAGAPEIVPLPREVALSLIGDVLITAPELRSAQQSAVRNLVGVPAFELRYTDLSWAIDRLERLVAEGG